MEKAPAEKGKPAKRVGYRAAGLGWSLYGVFIGFIFLLVLFPIPPLIKASYADIYWYVDEKGVRHYTNIPPTDSRYKLKYRTNHWREKAVGRVYNYSSFREEIVKAGTRHGIDPDLIRAVIRVESNFNPRAVSHKGAMGIMQLMPGTAKIYGVWDPFNPVANIEGGTRHLRDLMRYFNGNLRLALAAYNAGKDAVIKYGFKVPPYTETVNYVEKVLTHYALLKR